MYAGDIVFCEVQKIGQSSGPCRFDDRSVLRIVPATPTEAEKYMMGPGSVEWPEKEHGWCYRTQIYGRLVKAVMHFEDHALLLHRAALLLGALPCIATCNDSTLHLYGK